MSFPRSVVLPVLLVAALVLAGMIWLERHEDDSGSAIRPGDRVSVPVSGDTSDEVDTVDGLSARLPYGTATLAVRTGRQVTVAGDVRRTSGAMRWVTVSWTPRLNTYDGFWPGWSGRARQQEREPVSGLVLVADGRRYQVTKRLLASQSSGSATIAVARATGMRLIAQTPGRDQKVNRSGGSGVVRTTASDAVGRCDRGDRADGDVDLDRVGCSLRATRAGYIEGLGMAPSGQDWVVVSQARVEREGESSDARVGSWDSGSSGEDVGYVPTGRPSLSVEVAGAEKPERTTGTTRLVASSPSLETRAYLVPSRQPTTVTMTYRTAVKVAPGTSVPAGAPQTARSVGSAAVTLAATQQ